MGLYNNVADSMSGLLGGAADKVSSLTAGGAGKISEFTKGGNVLGKVDGAIRSGASSAGEFGAGMLGGGKLATAISKAGASMGASAISNKMNSMVPAHVRNAINTGAESAGQLLSGDWEGAALTVLESGEVGSLIGGVMSGIASQGRYWGSSSQLYGGITPNEARRIYGEVMSARRAKKNLFLLKVGSALAGDFSQTFNLFCTDIDLNPINLSGEKRRVGAAMIDSVQSSEAVDLRITTLDDHAGTLKLWFEQHADAVAARDGTVGVPASYAITFTVQHAFVGDARGFQGKGLYRPVSYEVGLSRRDDALEEIQMTFTQLDTFVRP